MEETWCEEEELVLRYIQNHCEYLSRKYRTVYVNKGQQQAKFRIPSIILGGITSVTSFGSYSFPPSTYRVISMTVGGISLFIAILNTIESYMKIGETMGASLQTSVNFQKLADQISCELTIPRNARTGKGIIYLKDCFALYQKYLDAAPPVLQTPFLPLPKMTPKIEQILHSTFRNSLEAATPSSQSTNRSWMGRFLSSMVQRSPPSHTSLYVRNLDRTRTIPDPDRLNLDIVASPHDGDDGSENTQNTEKSDPEPVEKDGRDQGPPKNVTYIL